jgi:hypothetical protein
MLTLQGIPASESLSSLRDDVVLERQALPDQADWEEVASRVSHIFGVTLQPLPTLANLQKMDTQVRELVTKHAGEVSNYLGKLRTTLTQICGACIDFPRFKTADTMSILCAAIQQARTPLELFEAVRKAPIETSPAGVGVVFKQALQIHRALDQIRHDIFDQLGQIQDDPRSSVGQGLRRQLQDALKADEHVTSLDSIVRRWLDDAIKILLDRSASVPQPTPFQPESPVITSPPTQPGRKVMTGSRRASGLTGWKSITEEIEREMTEDAEVDVTWRIEKKSV